MARVLRLEYPGAWYHVTARGNERRPIFGDDRDRRHFLELVPTCLERFRLRLHAYVLMDNHYHLLLETREANLSRAMQWLNTAYTVWYNRRHQRVGHLFQGRYKAVIVEPETWALELSRYIHVNPVRIRALGLDKAAQRAQRQGAGRAPDREVIQERLRRLRQYRWSSYRAYAGWEKAPPWLDCQEVLAFGGGRASERRVRYRASAEDVVREGAVEQPWEGLVAGLVLGSESFVEQLLERPKSAARQAMQVAVTKRPKFANVKQVMEGLKGACCHSGRTTVSN
jgi:putative transposase